MSLRVLARWLLDVNLPFSQIPVISDADAVVLVLFAAGACLGRSRQVGGHHEILKSWANYYYAHKLKSP